MPYVFDKTTLEIKEVVEASKGYWDTFSTPEMAISGLRGRIRQELAELRRDRKEALATVERCSREILKVEKHLAACLAKYPVKRKGEEK